MFNQGLVWCDGKLQDYITKKGRFQTREMSNWCGTCMSRLCLLIIIVLSDAWFSCLI